MRSDFEYASRQYGFIRESRQVLLGFCETISPIDFLHENSSFGRGGSIRNLLVHIVNTYEFWVGKHALNKDIVFADYQSNKSIGEVIRLFSGVDALMDQFMTSMTDPGAGEIVYNINGVKASVGAFRLFSHVITHEFHHKGQILSISRHLGYTPVDTDIVR